MELPYQPYYKDCLDKWLASYDEFSYAFLRECYLMSKALGYYPDIDFAALKIAHANWAAQCPLWEKTRMMPNSHGLSQIKVLSILLFQLSCVEWVTCLREYDASGQGIEFPGTVAERDEARKDLAGGGGTYLAFQFTILLVNWFEFRRTDRLQKFEFRLTTALEHDIMVYLLSEQRDELAVYLILHALYTRDPA